MIRLIILIETERNKLCYGKARSKDEIMRIIDLFNELKDKFVAMGYVNEL